MFLFSFLFLLISSCCLDAKEKILFNLVHGTWSQKAAWHKEQGGFFKTVKNWANKKYIEPQSVSIKSFEWSGALSHKSRIKAGEQLAHTIKNLPVDTVIHIIAHSHGANVVFTASQILAEEKSKHHIESCFLLGAPIKIERYKPNMEKISYIYNMFSFKDYVQTVFGTYERTLPEHEKVMNLQITIHGIQPGHSELISETVAKWIPYFHEFCQEKKDSFHACSYKKPGIVHFFQDKKPMYAVDKDQKKLIAYDKKMQKRLFGIYGKEIHKSYLESKNSIYQETNSSFFEPLLNQAFLHEHQLQEMNKDR